MMTDQLEHELRGAFARNAGAGQIPAPVHARLVQRDYHPRTAKRGLLAGAAAAAVTAGITVPLAMSAGAPATAGTVIRVASHTFHMPSGYRLTTVSSAPCHPFDIYVVPPETAETPAGKLPARLSGMKAAASAQGCLVFALAPRYTPTPAAPDPEAYTDHPVQVGKYHGYIFHMSVDVQKGSTSTRGVTPGAHRATNVWVQLPARNSQLGHLAVSTSTRGFTPGAHRATGLWVQLPAGNGQLRDLAVGATGISDADLIKLVAQGLSS